MKIIPKSDAFHIIKPEGTIVDYYLFPEYEIHFTQIDPQTTQVWHHHEKVWETLFILTGELIVKWKEDDKEVHHVVTQGDVVETQRTPHTIQNNTDKTATYIVIKQLLTGQNKSDILKNDKVLD